MLHGTKTKQHRGQNRRETERRRGEEASVRCFQEQSEGHVLPAQAMSTITAPLTIRGPDNTISRCQRTARSYQHNNINKQHYTTLHKSIYLHKHLCAKNSYSHKFHCKQPKNISSVITYYYFMFIAFLQTNLFFISIVIFNSYLITLLLYMYY